MNEGIYVVIPSLLTAFGFVFRFFWERRMIQIENRKKEYSDKIQFKLKNFYYPLYFNLNKLSHLWSVRQEYKKDLEMGHCIEDECLQIHTENQNIIQNNIVEVNPVPKLLDAILLYDKHVTVHKMLCKMKTQFTAKSFDADYPEQFKDTVRHRIVTLENEII